MISQASFFSFSSQKA